MKLDSILAPSAGLVLALSLILSTLAAAATQGNPRPAPEPNFKIASEWWADLWNIWTPVGWKDHLHRFNVLWNGTILAKPNMNRRSSGQGLQLSLTTDYEEWTRKFRADTLRHDDHHEENPATGEYCKVNVSWTYADLWTTPGSMDSLFAGAVSRQTRISCETRGGITGNVFAASLAIYLARLAMIDEQLTPGELHLLRLMPLAWLVPGKVAIFRQVPTERGPVTVETRLSADSRTMEVTYQPVFRGSPSKVWLHIPPLQRLNLVKVNGRSAWSGGARVVALGTEFGVKSTSGNNP